MKFLGQGFQTLEHRQRDRPTHTDRRDLAHHHAVFIGGNNKTKDQWT